MQGKRFTDEFKLEAVKMITERGVPVKELSDRLGVSTWSLYQWVRHNAVPPEQGQRMQSSVALSRARCHCAKAVIRTVLRRRFND